MKPANPDIPEKTSSGSDEIRNRALGLPARLRILLLLVDGMKSLSELKIMLPSQTDLEQALDTLVARGLVRFRTPPGTASEPRQEIAMHTMHAMQATALEDTGIRGAAAVSGASTMDRAGAIPHLTDHGLMRARAHIANALDDLLGFQAYGLRQQVAACSSAAELEQLHEEVQSRLTAVMEPADAASVIGRAITLVGAAAGRLPR